MHISIDLKGPHDKKGMICKDPEVNSNFQEVFYFLKIRVYFSLLSSILANAYDTTNSEPFLHTDIVKIS